MNPLTNTRNITKLNEREISLGIKENSSWHNEYKDSAWIFVGGLSYELSEGDILCVFSQYGEIVNINLVRDKTTGKTKGFCFICYEDQRSTILAVDNFNGIKLCSRIIRVDHVAKYRIPKDGEDVDEETQKLREEGCAPTAINKVSEPVTKKLRTEVEQKRDVDKREKKKDAVMVKTERKDPGYDKYETQSTLRPNNSDTRTNQFRSEQKSERDTSSSSSKHKSKHSSKEIHKSQRPHAESAESDEKTRKHKSHRRYAQSDDSDEKIQKHKSKRHHTESDDSEDKTHKHKSKRHHTESDDSEDKTRKHKSHRRHVQSEANDEKTHKHKSQSKHSKHRH